MDPMQVLTEFFKANMVDAEAHRAKEEISRRLLGKKKEELPDFYDLLDHMKDYMKLINPTWKMGGSRHFQENMPRYKQLCDLVRSGLDHAKLVPVE